MDRQSLPLAVRLAAATGHDSEVFDVLLDAVPALCGGRRGQPTGDLGRLPREFSGYSGTRPEVLGFVVRELAHFTAVNRDGF